MKNGRPTVLIVEDNVAHMELAAFVLEKLGCAVLRAASAEEGLALAREKLPDAVLVDIRLPGMGGLEATRALKADAATASIKVIVVTSFRDDEHASAAGTGADRFLRKPYHYRELADALGELLAPRPE